MGHDLIVAAARRLNLTAMFYPAGDDEGDYPCIEVGGVQVYAYIDQLGRLRVSIDTETAEIPEREDGTTPVIICMNEALIYDDSGEESLPCYTDRLDIPDTNPFAEQFVEMCASLVWRDASDAGEPGDQVAASLRVPEGCTSADSLIGRCPGGWFAQQIRWDGAQEREIVRLRTTEHCGGVFPSEETAKAAAWDYERNGNINTPK